MYGKTEVVCGVGGVDGWNSFRGLGGNRKGKERRKAGWKDGRMEGRKEGERDSPEEIERENNNE